MPDVSHPLGIAAWRNQVSALLQLQQIHGHREQATTLSPTNLQQVVVSEPASETDKSTEHSIECPLESTRSSK